MRSILFATALSLLSMNIKAIETEKNIKSKPEKVTVYLQGAQLFRSNTISLPQGQSTLIFEGLENAIDPQSIQASGTGNCIITETQYLLHYPGIQKLKVNGNGNLKYTKALVMLEDSLTLLSYETENITNQRDVLTTEKGVLLNYNLYKGLSKKDSIAFLKDGLSFLREKMNNINNELLRLKKEEAKLTVKINSITTRKEQIESELNNKDVPAQPDVKPDYRIIVTVVAEAATTVTIGINYFVPNAGWAPTYDLRTESMDKPIQLTYKATVFQNTGNDWKDVKLTLSTANPKQNLNMPVLNPYFVDVYRNNLPKKSTKTSTGSDAFNSTTILSAPSFNYNSNTSPKSDVVISSEEAYDYVVMDENLIQAEFEIKLAYSIPSDNKNHFVSILNKELKTNYVHKTIPKLDLKAYLTARIYNYEELNLLPGKANVYFGGTFIGKTFIQTDGTGDTLELSLGQDKNVTVTRTKIKDKSKEKVMDNDKYYDVAYEIIVKNGNSRSIDIEILDQVPLAKSQQIVIEKMELNGAKQNEATGEIKWRNTIKARDNKKSSFSFMVKAPKNMQLVVK